MAVRIRMTRMGRRHRPFFRINAVESRTPRDGRVLEKLGHYDPLEKDEEKKIVLNLERVKHWMQLGAVPTDTVAEMLVKRGIACPSLDAKKARRDRARIIARKLGKPFTQAEKEAAAKAAEAKKKDETQASA